MRKPAVTLPQVEEMPNVPKMPRQTGKWRGTPIGGKMGDAKDDMADGTQINVPGQTDQFMKHGHEPTAIESEHVFGQRNGGERDNNGYKMHMNPQDMARGSNIQADDAKAPKIKIPRQPRLRMPKS